MLYYISYYLISYTYYTTIIILTPGIFIGADDIRQQLPEEAKKFDAIDKNFKAIMTTTQ